jgi:putative oxidoreductase
LTTRGRCATLNIALSAANRKKDVMSFVLLVLRAAIGTIFVGHGAQKVLGKFGGYGPDGTGQFFESIGLRPGKTMALAAGGSEMTGGALMALGLATPAAASGLMSVMETATWTVHRQNGLWADKGGFEYPLVMTAALLTVVTTGPGTLSLDAARAREQWGPGWALAALAAATAGSAAVITAGRRQGPQPSAPSGVESQEAPAGAVSPSGS